MQQDWEVWIVFAALAASLVMFIGGWWRYDAVALLVLLALATGGIIPAGEAFAGFGHAAVITVAAVLVVSRGLENAGVINPIARAMGRLDGRPMLQVTALTVLIAVCSGFMNNVGALAILMPVAITMTRRSGASPSMLLMPIAFGSLLGGMLTLIGTPPNIIIATYRSNAVDHPFRMFDFLPVGVAVATVGVLFIAIVGWRLIPKRQAASEADELFDITDYLAELRVPEDSDLIGTQLVDLDKRLRRDDSEGGDDQEGTVAI